MAIERNPNDPYSAAPNDELLRRRNEQFDTELQADPELAEGPARGGRIALFAIAIVAVLGVVFYGLNNSSTSPDATPTAHDAGISFGRWNSSGAARADGADHRFGYDLPPSQLRRLQPTILQHRLRRRTTRHRRICRPSNFNSPHIKQASERVPAF
jgi:hypothetical protein